MELLLGDRAIKILNLLGEGRVVLGHEAEGQTAAKFQEEGGQSIQGVLNLPREYEVPDKDPFFGQFRGVFKDV